MRLGFALVTLTFVIGLVLVAVVDDPVGRAVMAAVSLTAFVRAALLFRSVRRGAART